MALTAQQMLDKYLEAEAAVLEGRTVIFNGRTHTMEDIEKIRADAGSGSAARRQIGTAPPVAVQARRWRSSADEPDRSSTETLGPRPGGSAPGRPRGNPGV
ncbi:hypothetical protein [Pseudomonas aeruginosa]|uniref:hypothetical protein n=1 Tax=Pseudomonas aeruginosa TaxID=287 RepID=UPI000A6DC9AD|nr:hypothetical protein [Pseudomonas aeruginosa]